MKENDGKYERSAEEHTAATNFNSNNTASEVTGDKKSGENNLSCDKGNAAPSAYVSLEEAEGTNEAGEKVNVNKSPTEDAACCSCVQN